MNPDLEVHPMYRSNDPSERARLTLTRFRLSSHNLAIEKGRWTRKPREERLCPTCNVVQDELHAVRECRINANARNNIDASHLQLPQLFKLEPALCHELIKISYNLLRFQNNELYMYIAFRFHMFHVFAIPLNVLTYLLI
jgi:hypothetical protein